MKEKTKKIFSTGKNCLEEACFCLQVI